jgi:predicted ATP-grasp superfamily ATP-dependent carboligase
VASFTRLAPTQWSRSCNRRLRITVARDDANGLVEQLRRELSRESYATLLTGSDGALLAVSRQRERLRGLTDLGLPSHEVVVRALSRESPVDAAEAAGLVPATSIRCVGVDDALAAARCLGYPVVLKSTEAVRLRDGVLQNVPKGQIATDDADLERRMRAFSDGLLVQRRVDGDVISVGGVMAGGALLAIAVSRYKRMWPSECGSATFSETVAPPPGLEDRVGNLLLTIGWEGIFELELIQSGPDAFVPIDLNPRPYGSMALATGAGAPLARIWCDWLLERDPQPARARPGALYRWEDGDIRHLVVGLRRRRFKAAMAPLKPHRGVTHALFKRSDPLPSLVAFPHLARLFVSKRLLAR